MWIQFRIVELPTRDVTRSFQFEMATNQTDLLKGDGVNSGKGPVLT